MEDESDDLILIKVLIEYFGTKIRIARADFGTRKVIY